MSNNTSMMQVGKITSKGETVLKIVEHMLDIHIADMNMHGEDTQPVMPIFRSLTESETWDMMGANRSDVIVASKIMKKIVFALQTKESIYNSTRKGSYDK